MESPKPEHAPAPTMPAASKRVALITDASSGLGREFARQLDNLQVADELWLVARDQTALNAVASSLDTPARPLAADLTDPEAIERLRTLLATERPRVTFLVNAAGFGKFGNWQAISDHAVDAMVDLNCRALVDVTRASPQAAALRLIGKVVPSCITMAGWNLLRRL